MLGSGGRYLRAWRMALRTARAMAGEASGALGDLGTLLPYVIAAVAGGILAPTPVFLGFAGAYLTVALLYRLPIAVQPMKALGAVLIAGGLSATGAMIAAMVIGVVLLILAASPMLDKAARAVPQSVVAGLQAGLGLMLASIALAMMNQDWAIAAVSLALLSLSLVWQRGPWALIVVAGAILLLPHAPPESLGFAGQAQFSLADALALGVIPQLPLTLLNAIVVTAALARSLYGDAAATVTERRLAASTGVLNLVLAPLGAMPMCHGAGGVAAHHRFGARGMAAPLIMAGLCALAAVLPEFVILLSGIPAPVTGALLTYAAADLVISRRLFDARPDCRPVIAVTALLTFLQGAAIGFVAGVAAEALRAHIVRRMRIREAGASGPHG